MHTRSYGKAVLLGLLSLVLLGVGCKKPVAGPPPTLPTPPAPAPARPTVTLQASSTLIQKGETVTLNWSSTNATELNLAPGVGRVAPEGSTQVSPDASITYTITATGPGGSAEASARITVGPEQPPPRPSRPPVPDLAGRRGRAHADRQLRQGETVLHDQRRNLLAEESPGTLR